jgi:hypothetical protein
MMLAMMERDVTQQASVAEICTAVTTVAELAVTTRFAWPQRRPQPDAHRSTTKDSRRTCWWWEWASSAPAN